MATGLLATDIRVLFTDEVAALGGVVSDAFQDGPILLARSVLPRPEDVAAGDRVQGGVALRTDERDVFVSPYVFRLVCQNGAIMANALETREIALDDFPSPVEAAEAVREAIRASAAPEAFADAAERMRAARDVQADLALNLMPLLARLPAGHGAEVVRAIMRRFVDGRDRSHFGLVNAVTATARDTREPGLRWRLEEFGGGLLVSLPSSPVLDGRGAAVYETAAV